MKNLIKKTVVILAGLIIIGCGDAKTPDVHTNTTILSNFEKCYEHYYEFCTDHIRYNDKYIVNDITYTCDEHKHGNVSITESEWRDWYCFDLTVDICNEDINREMYLETLVAKKKENCWK